MPSNTAVDRLYKESASIISAIGTTEPSLLIAAGDSFRKGLILAAASHFEHRICSCVLDFIKERVNDSDIVVTFVRNKAISRQYHTWFKWDETNANQFFGLFGSQFKHQMMEHIKQSDELKDSIKAFLEVGNERNKLVHQDFASFPLEKTLDEIYDLYKISLFFLENLAYYLRECQSPASPE